MYFLLRTKTGDPRMVKQWYAVIITSEPDDLHENKLKRGRALIESAYPS